MKYDNPSGTSDTVQDGTCTRCHGFLVPSFSEALSDEITRQSFAPAWRCVNCGEWVDATIAENRRNGRHSDASSAAPSSPFSRRRWR
jgi:hypothetical protein